MGRSAELRAAALRDVRPRSGPRLHPAWTTRPRTSLPAWVTRSKACASACPPSSLVKACPTMSAQPSTPRSRGIRKAGRQAGAVSLPRTELSVPVYYILAPAEASSNLSRFDGVKVRPPRRQVRRPQRHVQKTRAEGFGDEVKRRIMIGAYVVRRLLRRLLPAGAEDPPHDRRRLPGRLQGLRATSSPARPRRRRPGPLAARPTGQATTWPTSSPCPPRWPVYPVSACLQASATAACPWACS